MDYNEIISKLKFDDRGLIPTIVQDSVTREVLMMAYMNAESLKISLDEGRTCFYSRSRQELWRKGETSSNTQRIVSIATDCDGDTLLINVEPAGPACHTGAISCFYENLSGEDCTQFSLNSLYALIKGRQANPVEGSYTNYLFEKGREKILKKVGEESAEVIIAAMKNSVEESVYEISDLCYHTLVLMCEMGISPEDIIKELAKRHKK